MHTLQVSMRRVPPTTIVSLFISNVGVCPVLSPPAYGNVTVSGQSIGDYATYTCDSGFELDLTNGSEVRTCRANGMWSGYPAACVRKSLLHLLWH